MALSNKGKELFIRNAVSQDDINHCFAIRHKVFIEGQGISIEEELDEYDATCNHYILFYQDEPAGVARVRYKDDFAKIERVAILEVHQGKGLGYALMKFILADIGRTSSVQKAKLSSQTYAIPFYEKLGFTICSEEYIDAGIPHRDMQLVF